MEPWEFLKSQLTGFCFVLKCYCCCWYLAVGTNKWYIVGCWMLESGGSHKCVINVFRWQVNYEKEVYNNDDEFEKMRLIKRPPAKRWSLIVSKNLPNIPIELNHRAHCFSCKSLLYRKFDLFFCVLFYINISQVNPTVKKKKEEIFLFL